MGSDSDLNVMQEAAAVLKQFDIAYEMTVASAHRTPQRAAEFASTAIQRGLKVIIAGAGHAAHLAGAMAAHTTLPIIGVPIDSSAFQGLDALLSTVQMPPGVPVATVAFISSRDNRTYEVQRSTTTGYSIYDPQLAEKLVAFKAEMASKVLEKAKKLEQAL